METRIKRAIRNNAQWCQLVCCAHGRPGEFFDEIWINRAPLPRFYPNAQTLAERSSGQINLIRELVDQGLPSGWAVKDSFASLDLTTCGFIPLFDAQWLYLSQDRLSAVNSASAPRVHWEIVRADQVLAEWERAWCEAHRATNHARVYLPALLEDRDIAIVAACRATILSEAPSGTEAMALSDGRICLLNRYAIYATWPRGRC